LNRGKLKQPREILAFVDYSPEIAGVHPDPVVFDARPTTYAVLDELGAQGITWLTLRQRAHGRVNDCKRCPTRRGRSCASIAPPATAAPSCATRQSN
jgi:hypothetical protein